MTMVLPIDRSSRRSSRSSTLARGSRPDAGSSRSSTCGSWTKRVREAQPLLHAARQVLDVGVASLAEIDQLEQVADHPAPTGRGQPIAAREEVEVLPDLHVVVDTERVRHEPEDAPDLVGVPGHGPAVDLGAPGVGTEQGREHPQRGRLAGAVGPDQPEDLALVDGQVDAGHGDRPVVALDQALGADDRAHSTSPVMEMSIANPTPSVSSLTKRTSTVPDVGST